LKIVHLAGDLAGECPRIEPRDMVDAGAAADQSIPEGVFPDSVGGDSAQTCHYNTSLA
jgi:hypothetical protein